MRSNVRPYHTSRSVFVIYFSFLLAMILTVLPVPVTAISFAPQWVLWLILFWTAETPQSFGVFSAWCVGLLLDCLLGSTLGFHAFLFVLVAYIWCLSRQHLTFLCWWQEQLLILLCTSLYFIIPILISYFASEPSVSGWYWLSLLTTVGLWPLFAALLRTAIR